MVSNRGQNRQSGTEPWRNGETRSGGDDGSVVTFDPAVFEESDPVDVSDLFELLADPGRRYVLTYLLRSEGHVTCTELVDYVADRTETTMTPAVFRDRVATRLTHTHLPKLDDAGLIAYNVERQLVEPTSRTRAALPYLQLALEHQRRQSSADE